MPVDLNLLILNTIKTTSKYGLEIIDEIKNKTNGEIILKQPSLYSALRRLEARGLVTSFWKDSDLGGKRHYYKATEQGLNELNNDISINNVTNYYLSNKKIDIQEDALSPSPSSSINTVSKKVDDDDDDDDFEPLTAFGVKPKTKSEVEESEEEKEEIKEEVKTVKIKTDDKSSSTDSSYLEDLEKLFGNSFSTPKKTEKEVEESKINSYSSLNNNASNFELLEKISERYNKKNKPVVDAEGAAVSSPIKEKKEVGSINREEEVKTYLYINKINLVSGLCLFTINLAVLLTVLILYLTKNWMDLEKYIILGSTLFLSISVTLYNIICYHKFPSKKISYKFNWFKSFLMRLFVTILLAIAIVSINLLVGMENFNQLTNTKYFIRWFVPAVFILNIMFRWILNLLLSCFKSFQIFKKRKHKKAI